MLWRTFLFCHIKKSLRTQIYFSSHVSLKFVFNNKLPKKSNSTKCNRGLFDVPELSSYGGFYDLKEKCVQQTNALVQEATSDDRSRKIVEIFDDLSDSLCKVADLAEFIRLAHPNRMYTEYAEMACGAVSEIVEKLNTDKKLFDVLKFAVDNGDKMKTSKQDDHVAKLFLFDFEQSGIHLPQNKRNEVVRLNNEIMQIGQQFVAGSSLPRSIHKDVFPTAIQYILPRNEDQIVLNGMNADSSNSLAREMSYRIYLLPDLNQEQLLIELLSSRKKLAEICDFKNYADRALRGTLMENQETVTQFLNNLSENLKIRATNDFKIMKDMKNKEESLNKSLEPWDVPYYTQKYKSEKLQINRSEYSQYFSLGSCMEGLNILFKNIFGITLDNVEMCKGECWADDVHKLAVIHETEGPLGYIYCDFFERSGKPSQDCHFTIRGGRILPDGNYQIPIVVISMNLPVPRWSGPTLLTPNMVDNLFHEMGHAMHSMLGRTRYQHVSGTRCSTDFAEVPSVLMEYFARDPRVIRRFAKHFQTNTPMPEEMLKKLCASKHLFTASEMQMQLFYSALDQEYHINDVKNGTTEILKRTQEKYYNLPYVEHTAWQLRFSHLVGYGAKYYSYLVSTALASWIWRTYFEEDPLSRKQGERYRRECLEYGGGKPPSKLVADFLKREPSPSLLANSLIQEIDSKNDFVANVLSK